MAVKAPRDKTEVMCENTAFDWCPKKSGNLGKNSQKPKLATFRRL